MGEGLAGRREHTIGLLYVVLSAVCFSIAGALIKTIPWNSFSISAGRSVFAAAVVFIYLHMSGRRFHINKSIILGALINYLMMQSFIVANTMTTAANSIVLMFTEPIWVILLVWLLLHERPKRADVLACVAVAIGIVCFFSAQLSPTGMIGNLLAIVSGLAYAGVFLIKKMPGSDFECSLIISFAACIVTGVPFLVQETSFDPGIIAAVVALGSVQAGLSYVFLSKGLDLVSPITASITSIIEPVLSPVIAAVFIGELMGATEIAGAVIILAATAIYNAYITVKKE